MAVTARELRALDVRRPFSRAQARAAGIRLREILGPQFHKILYDSYVSSSVRITTRLRAEAALSLSPPGSYISHHTAAELWGGVVPACSDVHLTVAGTAPRSRRQGIRAHSTTGSTITSTLYGLRISSPTQTFLDLASSLDLVELVVLGDSLVKAKRVTPEDLTAAASDWTGSGAARARKAARFVRKGVDSPKETGLRMLLVLAGLPEPTVNFIIRNPDGSWRMRFDLSYPGLKLIIEYDGRQHAENSAQWRRDLSRREELDREGWRLIVVTSDDLRDAPEAVLNRVREALIDRGAVGIRRRFKTEWIRYFPSRA
jgi:very-short-patch-repair endonuclease